MGTCIWYEVGFQYCPVVLSEYCLGIVVCIELFPVKRFRSFLDSSAKNHMGPEDVHTAQSLQ